MSCKQNDNYEEAKQEAIEERETKEYTKKELIEMINREMIKVILTITDWKEIDESMSDYKNGLISLETHNRNVAFSMGLIEKRAEDSKKIMQELKDDRGDNSAKNEGDRKGE